MKAHTEQLQLYSVFNLGARCGWVVIAILRPINPRERELVQTAQEAGWAPQPGWNVAENLAPTGIRALDCPARSKSLCRLRCPSPVSLLYLLIQARRLAVATGATGATTCTVTDVQPITVDPSLLHSLISFHGI
jgi:hypothetical protein